MNFNSGNLIKSINDPKRNIAKNNKHQLSPNVRPIYNPAKPIKNNLFQKNHIYNNNNYNIKVNVINKKKEKIIEGDLNFNDSSKPQKLSKIHESNMLNNKTKNSRGMPRKSPLPIPRTFKILLSARHQIPHFQCPAMEGNDLLRGRRCQKQTIPLPPNAHAAKTPFPVYILHDAWIELTNINEFMGTQIKADQRGILVWQQKDIIADMDDPTKSAPMLQAFLQRDTPLNPTAADHQDILRIGGERIDLSI